MRREKDDPGPGAPPGGGRWVQRAAAALCLLVIFWMGLGWDALRRPETYRGRKNDYYSLLVHGFLEGHVYMDIPADPRLESPDPAVRATAPAPLDSSYYRGHFYLYFGVTPAAAILLPYARLTGGDLDPRLVAVLGVAAGFLFALGTWGMAASEHFPRLGRTSQAASVAMLAFASATPLLLTRAMFYEVAIAAGYGCAMSGFFWTYRAVSGRGVAWVQLAWAGLSFALAVGCRPDLALALPALAAAALVAARRSGRPLAGEILRNGAAAAVPATVIGAGLAAYNFERFGSPFDFGFRYGMNGFMQNHFRLSSATYLWPNFHWYYLTLPAIGPYFPYVFPCRAEYGPAGYETGEIMHGQFPVFVVAAFVALSAALVGRRLSPGRLAPFLGMLAFSFLSIFLALCSLGIRADRYMVDFQAPLILGVVLLAGLAASRVGGRLHRPWVGAFALLGALAVAFNLFAGIEEFDAFKDLRTTTFERLEYAGNLPSGILQRLGLLRYGPLEVKAVFPKPEHEATFEPLLTLGTPRLNDTLYVIRYPSGPIQLLADHMGYPQPRSDLIPIVPGRAYTFTVDMGALYPPLNHPFFKGHGPMQARLLKSRVEVMMDGRLVFSSRLGSYDAPPWTLEFGREDISMSLARPRFSGTIISAGRLAPPGSSGAPGTAGIWRIQCVFPLQFPGASFPLVASGAAGTGTLLYVNIMPGSRVRFGIDEWFIGGAVSDPVAVEPMQEQTLDVFFGPIAWAAGRREALAPSRRRLNVWLNGRIALSAELTRPDAGPPGPPVAIGSNPQGFSTSRAEYAGPIEAISLSEMEMTDFLRRNIELDP